MDYAPIEDPEKLQKVKEALSSFALEMVQLIGQIQEDNYAPDRYNELRKKAQDFLDDHKEELIEVGLDGDVNLINGYVRQIPGLRELAGAKELDEKQRETLESETELMKDAFMFMHQPSAPAAA